MSKKRKLPFQIRFITWAFLKLEHVFPRMAHQWFVRIFFTPVRYPIPESEQEIIQLAERSSQIINGKKIQVYCWGTGPVVIFSHGWAGRAGQFRHFILPFNSAGFQVVLFDAPGHGLSDGKETNIEEFIQAIKSIAGTKENIVALVGHSLGGATSMAAINQGVPARALVTISTPTIGDEILNEFSKKIKASPRAVNYFREWVMNRFNRPFDEFTVLHYVKTFPDNISLMILHDEQDREASIRHAVQFYEQRKNALFIRTKGLGHNRILKDPSIVAKILEFIQMEGSTKS